MPVAALLAQIEESEVEIARLQRILAEPQSGLHYELYESAPVGLCWMDRHLRVQRINRVGKELLNFPADRILAKSLGVWFAGRDHAQYLSAVDIAARTGLPQERDLLSCVAGRKDRFLRVRIEAETREGEIAGYKVCFYDVTETRRWEEMVDQLNADLEVRIADRSRLANERAERMHALVLQLASAEHNERRRLAQELHDYLAQLLVAASLQLTLVWNAEQSAAQQERITEIRKIIGDAMRYTRTLVADLSPPVLFEEGFMPALHILGRKFSDQGLKINVAGPDRLDVAENVNVMAYQVTRELLMNTLKHARVEEATVSAEIDGDTLVLTVSDAGTGFDLQEVRQRSASEQKFGLFSIEERVEALGGQFEVDTAPGKGTRTTLRFPLPQKTTKHLALAEVPGSAEAGPAAKRVCYKVLIVDDHAMVREGLCALLEDNQLLAIAGVATDGVEAIEKARELMPDVVLMDINMPRMNGIDATRQIRLEMPSCRVIGISMRDDDEARRLICEAGAEALIGKDCSIDEILRHLGAVTGHAAKCSK